jgi:glycosyltransferase involved in cell wall biosynthesis
MRILYLNIRGHAGGDVFFEILKETQAKRNEQLFSRTFNRYWSLCPQLLPIFKKVNLEYDIVHSDVLSTYLFKHSHKPIVASIFEVITKEFQDKYLNAQQRIYYHRILKLLEKGLKKTDFIITISRASENAVRNYFQVSNVKTIYCAINTEIYKPITITNDPYPNKIKLLFVGNLTKRKGVDLLPKIMSKLDNRFLLFYTTGLRSPRKIFSDERMIPLERLSRDELVYWYNLCDMLVLPTRLEGFGYAVAEAMACEKPIVTTNCSSLPEIVINEENGFLCKIDDINNFVDKIMILADNPDMRKKIGKKNRIRIIENFNLAKMGKEYNDLYRKIIEER